MKKITAYAILVAVLLAVFSTSTMAGNPPGMIVRQDDRLEDSPWGEADCYINTPDYDDCEIVNDEINSDITIDITIVDIDIPVIFNKIIILMSVTPN